MYVCMCQSVFVCVCVCLFVCVCVSMYVCLGYFMSTHATPTYTINIRYILSPEVFSVCTETGYVFTDVCGT